jgi:glycosyltransferase involved in cell wall biosynthesis
MTQQETPQFLAPTAVDRQPAAAGRLSVVMAAYNGAQFLAEQIRSLTRQTTLPHELVVYDDCSTDRTRDVLAEETRACAFEVVILHGERNVGVNAAFQRAIEASSGDVVFFCDQDDIWKPEKVEKYLSALKSHPEAGFVFSDARQISATGEYLGSTVWERIGFTPERRSAFQIDPLATLLRRGNLVYGMASAFRGDLLRTFLPIPPGMTHDTWFALHAAAIGAPGVLIPTPLVDYRRHGMQASAGSRARKRPGPGNWPLGTAIEALTHVKANVAKYAGRHGTNLDLAIEQLDRKINFLKKRKALIDGKSASRALLSLFDPDYWFYARGGLSVLRDYLVPSRE